MEKQAKIEIYAAPKGHDWELKAKASPGNLSELEDTLFRSAQMEESQIMIAITIQVKGGQRVCARFLLFPLH